MTSFFLSCLRTTLFVAIRNFNIKTCQRFLNHNHGHQFNSSAPDMLKNLKNIFLQLRIHWRYLLHTLIVAASVSVFTPFFSVYVSSRCLSDIENFRARRSLSRKLKILLKINVRFSEIVLSVHNENHDLSILIPKGHSTHPFHQLKSNLKV